MLRLDSAEGAYNAHRPESFCLFPVSILSIRVLVSESSSTMRPVVKATELMATLQTCALLCREALGRVCCSVEPTNIVVEKHARIGKIHVPGSNNGLDGGMSGAWE